MVVEDHFKKFAQAFLKKKINREDLQLIHYLTSVFLDFGFQNEFCTNKERNWTINSLGDCLKLPGLSLQKLPLTMGNRLCKRMNQTLLNMMKTLPEIFKSDWKSNIKKIDICMQ